jgi:hypothetical protein
MEGGEAGAEVVGKERSEVQWSVRMSDSRQRTLRHRAWMAKRWAFSMVSVGSRRNCCCCSEEDGMCRASVGGNSGGGSKTRPVADATGHGRSDESL